MSILSPALKGFMRLRESAIENFMHSPVDTQLKEFHSLISAAQFTEWGKKYDYHALNSISDFQKAVPINDYEGIKPYIQRVMEGEQNIIWPSDITWFAKSSGTSSDKSKFIPVSKESLDENHYRA